MYKDFIENTWMALRSGVWFGLESSMDENPYVNDGRRSGCPFFPLPQKTRLKNNKKCYSHWSWLARHQQVVTFFSSVGLQCATLRLDALQKVLLRQTLVT